MQSENQRTEKAANVRPVIGWGTYGRNSISNPLWATEHSRRLLLLGPETKIASEHSQPIGQLPSRENAMNKVFSLLLIVAIAIGIVPDARSLGTPEPPRGVAADHWVPMGDVITGDASDPKQGLRMGGSGQVKGYFMIRQGASWSRISNEQEEGVFKASITR